jgi:hypothetical protein
MANAPELHGNWNYPTSIRFGAGRITELPDVCRELGMLRPLMVTDPGLAQLPIVHNTVRICAGSGIPCRVFSNIQSNPVGANVGAGVEAYRQGGHDGVIALGGGSALDTGKAIALMVGQVRPLWDFEDREDWYTRVNGAGMATVIAVPTTAGTGSEVGRAAVVTDEREQTKKIIFHPRMLPAVVIADPALTTGLPPPITAATGMDALSHNLEAYCSPVFHPMAQGIALEAMALIREWLPVAYHDGANLTARACMLAASTMGATAFQKGLGAMHSLSHPCGALFDTHHGLTNAVVMPYVLLFNRPAIEGKMTSLARYLDLPAPSFQAVLDWILRLREEIGIPPTLAHLGVEEEYIERLAKMAAVDPSSAGNPVPLTVANLQQLYLNAINGVMEMD